MKSGLLYSSFVLIKVYPFLFITNTLICVVYVDDCLFWVCSQSNIDTFVNYFKGGVSSYNWKHSKVDSVSELLGIDVKTSDNGGSKFYQNGMI